MSDDTLNRIKKRINEIEKIGKEPAKNVKNPSEKKKYGEYQHFQSECMKKVDETNPNSSSRIGLITGREDAHSTEKMAMCSILWNKYRGMDNPTQGLMSELNQKLPKKTRNYEREKRSKLYDYPKGMWGM